MLLPRLPALAGRSAYAAPPLFEQIVPLEVRLGRRRLKARVCIPSKADPSRPPLVALHGISRDADAIIAGFAAVAEEAGRILLVPRFSRTHWPTFQRIGGVRPDKALLQIVDLATSLGLIPAGPFDLFGYSGGAQLAHRFAMLYPNRIATLHVAAAGWYCLPHPEIPSPVGLGANLREAVYGKPLIARLKQDQLGGYLRLPLRLYVGADDIVKDRALRACSLVAGSQGANRVERARTFHLSFRRAAETFGIEPDASLTLLPGCAHDFTRCAEHGGLARMVAA